MDDYFKKDRYAAFLGIEKLPPGQALARARLSIADHHRNGFGTVHGGAIFSLADTVFGQAANQGEQLGVALEVSISYLRPGLSGALTAEAREISRNRRVGLYEIRVADDQDRLVALFKGTAYFRDP